MNKLIIVSLLIFNSPSVFADINFKENKTVQGQLLMMDACNRIENGGSILKMPIADLESTITPSFITNSKKQFWVSPKYHSEGIVTPRLKCH